MEESDEEGKPRPESGTDLGLSQDQVVALRKYLHSCSI